MKFLRFAWLFTILFVQSQVVFSAGFSKDDAQGLVKQAAESYKTDGREKLIAAVNAQKGPYNKGELYLFLYDMTGKVVAHPAKPELIGANNYEVPDADGKLFRKEIVDNAKKGKAGWVEYKTNNAASGKTEAKIAYYQPLGELIAIAAVPKE